MELMSVDEVAKLLGVQPSRVERLARENLLTPVKKDDSGNPLFDKQAVLYYQQLASRLGGL